MFKPCYECCDWRAFADADNAWSDELGLVYGRKAGNMRYRSEGKATPDLKRLHDEREVYRVSVDNEQREVEKI